MSLTLALLLGALGCAPAGFHGPAGAFVIWVCPPIAADAPPLPEDQES